MFPCLCRTFCVIDDFVSSFQNDIEKLESDNDGCEVDMCIFGYITRILIKNNICDLCLKALSTSDCKNTKCLNSLKRSGLSVPRESLGELSVPLLCISRHLQIHFD